MGDKKLVAVAAFAKAISIPGKRRAFAQKEKDLDDLLKEEGADADDLPRDVRSFFESLSGPELRVLADLQATLKAEDLVDHIRSEEDHVTFTLGKF